jgi:hypothetical protein
MSLFNILCRRGVPFLTNQTFEMPVTGFANNETWVTAGTGTVNPVYATSPIQGTQSLLIQTSAQQASAYHTFTAQSTLFVKFRFRIDLGTTSLNPIIATIRNGTTVLATLSMAGTSSHLLRVTSGGGTANSSTDVIPTGTDLYGWFEYAAGTGSNAVARAGWATTDTKPTLVATGGKTCVSSNGTATASANRLYIGHTANTTVTNVFDVVQSAASAF